MITKEDYIKEFNNIQEYWSSWLVEQMKANNYNERLIKYLCNVAISGSNKDLFELLDKLNNNE